MTIEQINNNLDCKTQRELATRFGVTPHTMGRHLKKLGIDYTEYRKEKTGEVYKRPKIEIDWDWVKTQLRARTSGAAIARQLNLNTNYLYDRCLEDNGVPLAEFKSQAHAEGDDMLKNKMFEIAMKGNVQMLIWLSKNWLHYSDKPEDKTEQNVVLNFNLK